MKHSAALRLLLVALASAAGLTFTEAAADSIVAARRLPAGTLLSLSDLRLDAEVIGGLSDPLEIEGKETRVTIYAGRAIRAEDLGPPTLVGRNDLVTMDFATGGLTISTEGRALGRGGQGDVIRVMNLASKNAVSARVTAQGRVEVLAN
ncbi:flagellar basal body P-ring formation chaperone FlgA [Paracoccus pacificus]|uniref:Flagella basal body P-ring formation protein FlgA n=1 Tax=Paracoccus pacificus TaxID=1463598 RepID=A0ABW4R8X5_9RHOB